MAEKASRAAVTTVLKIGPVKAPVVLMKATADLSKSHKWEQRTPEEDDNIAKMRKRIKELTPEAPASAVAPPAAPPEGDPLGDGEAKPEQTQAEIDERREVEEQLATALKPRKGILKDDGAYVDLTDEIENVAERSKSEFMEVVSFIDQGHVPNARITASYYLAGGDDQEGLLAPSPVLVMLATAMRRANRYMLVRFSKKKGQTLGIVKPQRDGSLLLVELVFAEQWREPGPKALRHSQAQVPEERIEQAEELIEAMAGRRDSIDDIFDLRAQMENELIAKAKAGEMDKYTLPEVDPSADPDAEQLGELLKQAVAEAA